MADNSILTPGHEDTVETPSTVPEPEKYLQTDNYLSEYNTEEKSEIVRQNLNVPSKNAIKEACYSKAQTDELIKNAIQSLLLIEDPHKILPKVQELISLMTKTDGSTPFTNPQSGEEPLTDKHLTTKKYVDNKLKDHLNTNDPHNIIEQVYEILSQYAKITDVYTRADLYTRNQISTLLSKYTKQDGSTPFTNPQIGVDPVLDKHLTTKRYVESLVNKHKGESNPHGLVTSFTNALTAYAKKADVYNKSQTYTRTQVDQAIKSTVNSTVNQVMQEEVQKCNDYTNKAIAEGNFIKQDGSVPFTSPQKGVQAVEGNELVTLEQLNALGTKVDKIQTKWITSGPVKATVGLIDEGFNPPEELSIQEVFDSIFYGQTINISCPSSTLITEMCPITVCIGGTPQIIEKAEVYQQDQLIYTLTKEQFADGCLTVNSKPILEDTQFTFKVYYTSGSVHDVTASTTLRYPVFVGLLPKWKAASTITMDYLKELESKDTTGTQNRFVNKENDTDSITFKYKFSDAELKHMFLVIPTIYPDLVSLTTPAQRFGLEAFDIINIIPLYIEGAKYDMTFKIYVYRQTLSSLDQEVTYNFK